MEHFNKQYPYLLDEAGFLSIYPSAEYLDQIFLDIVKDYRKNVIKTYEEAYAKDPKAKTPSFGHSCVFIFIVPGDEKNPASVHSIPVEINSSLFSNNKQVASDNNADEVICYIASLLNKIDSIMNGNDMSHPIAESLAQDQLISSYKFLGCILAMEASSMRLNMDMLKGKEINLETIKELMSTMGLVPQKSLMFHCSTPFHSSIIQYKINIEDEKKSIEEEPFEILNTTDQTEEKNDEEKEEEEDEKKSISGKTAAHIFGNVVNRGYNTLISTNETLDYIKTSEVFALK